MVLLCEFQLVRELECSRHPCSTCQRTVAFTRLCEAEHFDSMMASKKVGSNMHEVVNLTEIQLQERGINPSYILPFV